MKTILTMLLQQLHKIWVGSEEHNTQRMLESILPVASLYGVDVANIAPEWFRDKAR